MIHKRMFELADGAATRFWEVWRDGSAVYTRFGRTGAGGQTKLKDEGSGEAAERAVDAEIRRKTEQGYVEAGVAPRAAASLDLDEVRRRASALEGDEDYAVFADWLIARGQPWGELVSVDCSLAKASAKQRASLEKARAELLSTHGAALLGPAAMHPFSRFEWHLGFVRAATLGSITEPAAILATLEAFLSQPVAQHATGIVLNPVPTSFDTKRDWDDSSENVVDPWTDLAAFARAIPERVTHVGFGGWPAPAASAYLRMPSFGALSEAFPRTRRLELTGWSNAEPGTLAMPELVELEVRYAEASSGDLAALAGSKLDKLERLGVWLGGQSNCVLDSVYSSDEGYPDSYDGGDLEALEVYDVSSYIAESDITDLLAALPPSVAHLAIRSTALGADLVAWLAASPRIEQLVSLDLSGGTLGDDAARALIAAKQAFAHLAVLDVERNRINAAAAKKLAAALPKARVGNQRKRGQPELFARYVAVME